MDVVCNNVSVLKTKTGWSHIFGPSPNFTYNIYELCYIARVIPPTNGADAMAYSSPTIYPSTREHEPQREIERRKKLRPADVLVRAATTELLRQQTGPRHFERRRTF